MSEQDSCLICDRIALIKQGKNPYFVKELETGYVVLGDHQFFHGYTLFLCKLHARELHEVEPSFRRLFLWEMSEVAAAVFRAFSPNKMNYELLGNTDAHMHWHLFPRRLDEPHPKNAIYAVPSATRNADSTIPKPDDLEALKATLLKELDAPRT